MGWSPSWQCDVTSRGERTYRVGHPVVDDFLTFVASRARPNTVRAYAHDLKLFFTVVCKDPVDVRPADVLAFTVPPILGEVIERKQPGQNWRPTVAAGAGDTLMYGLGGEPGSLVGIILCDGRGVRV